MICLLGQHFRFSYFKCSILALFFCKNLLYSDQSPIVTSELGDLESRIESVYNKYKSAVVRVKATKELISDGKSRRILKMGSGFFVSKDGHILTTGLLQDPDRIWIEHESSFFLAERIGMEGLCNLSLLKVDQKPNNFSFVPLGNTLEHERVGSMVVALTCALEFQVGPTHGLIQSKEFSLGKKIFPTMMLRCSLGLGPGEVGAPVFDLRGRFVGICHAALPDLRSSFVLPRGACQRIRDDLVFSGSVDYGWFGVTTTKTLNNKSGFDIVVQSLVEGSPASKSKLRSGDIIKQIDGKTINQQADLANISFFTRPDTIIEFLVRRGESVLKIPVKVTSRPQYTNSKQVVSELEQNSSSSDVEKSQLKNLNDN